MTVMTPKRATLAASGAFGLALALVGCSRESARPSAPNEEPIPVSVATVAVGDVADAFEAGGVVQARATATITARILAPVVAVRVAPGDRVRAGQELLRLDGGDLAAQARRARAAGVVADQDVTAAASDRQAAEAELVLARATHARIAGLHAKRSATAQELDDATGALRAAEARAAGADARSQAARSGVDVARASVEAADATESFARLTAPFDGVVTEKLVDPGNMAAPGMPLLRLEDTRDFRLHVHVDESRVGQIPPGAAVTVAFESDATGTTSTVEGRVVEVERAVDADARAFLVKILLPAEPGLRSGMFGRARFAGRPRPVVTVPAAALLRRGQLTSVFVVEQDVARLRLVNVSGTEVLAGLAEGEVVVVAPPPALTDGRRVAAGGR
jgi:RND family efflux transporter MFP subunit